MRGSQVVSAGGTWKGHLLALVIVMLHVTRRAHGRWFRCAALHRQLARLRLNMRQQHNDDRMSWPAHILSPVVLHAGERSWVPLMLSYRGADASHDNGRGVEQQL